VDSTAVLVVAATPFELAWVPGGTPVLACGVGPVEAAVAVSRALAVRRPAAVLHVGIAGAAAREGRALGDAVIGLASDYVDLAARFPGLVTRCEPDASLLALARRALPNASCSAIATSAAVGGAVGAEVEAMEGFGVLRACEVAGVPAVEVRTISNWIGEGDRARWDVGGALAALAEAGGELLLALAAPSM
jgi:futalosine hydrolase